MSLQEEVVSEVVVQRIRLIAKAQRLTMTLLGRSVLVRLVLQDAEPATDLPRTFWPGTFWRGSVKRGTLVGRTLRPRPLGRLRLTMRQDKPLQLRLSCRSHALSLQSTSQSNEYLRIIRMPFLSEPKMFDRNIGKAQFAVVL